MQAISERAPLMGARFALGAAFVGTVLVFETRTADPFGLPKLAVLWVTGLAALAGWVLACRARGRWMPWSRFATATVVLVGVTAVATAVSVAKADSLLGSYERYGGLLSLLLGAGMALLVMGVHGERPQGVATLAFCGAGAAVVLAAYVVLQAAGVDFVHWQEASGAAVKFQGGTMGNSDFAGGFLGLALPLLAFSLLHVWRVGRGRRGSRRSLWLVWAVALGTLVDLIALALTRSRGGIVAAVAGALTLAWLLRSDLPRRARRAAVVVGLAGLALAALILFVPGLARASGLHRTDLLRSESVSARGREWAGALHIIASRPVLGTGPDTFEYRFPRYRSDEDGVKLGMQIADKPHNVLLERASDTGLSGLAAYLAVVGVALAAARRRLAEVHADGDADADGPERLLLAALVAAFIAYLAQAFVSIDVVPLAFTGWLLLGCIAAMADPAVVARRTALADQHKGKSKSKGKGKGKARGTGRSPRQRPTRPTRPARPHGVSPWTAAGAVAVAAGLSAAAIGPVLADASALAAQRTSNRAASSAAWDTAVSRNRMQLTYRLGAGFAAEARGAESDGAADRTRFLQTAIDRYEEARRLAPDSMGALLGLARTTALWGQGVDPGRFPESDRWWGRVIAHDPRNPEVYYQHGLMLNAWANVAGGDVALRRRAAAAIERAVRVKTRDANMLGKLALIKQGYGDVAGAQNAARRALAIDPGNQAAKQVLAGGTGG
jgi:O-antigen ligase